MKFQLKSAVMALGIAALTACNINDNNVGSGTSATTVSGVAATGAPIVGGNVNLRCGNGVTASAVTSSNGQWSTTVPADSLPCYVKVSGGTPAGTFYSVAQTPSGSATTSTANVTPLSDLVIAAVVNSAGGGQALDVWFANDSPELRRQVADGIAAAVTQLRAALIAAGYDLPPGSFDPLTSAIVAGGAEDLYDLILEAYKAALAEAGSSYEDARDNYVDGADFPEAGDDSEPVEPANTTLAAGESGVRFATTGKVLGTAETNKLRYWTGPSTVNVGSNAGILNEVTVSGSEANSSFNLRDVPDAVGTYNCGYGFNSNKANVEIGFGANNGYNTMGTRGANESVTPGFRCTLTITKVGTRNGRNYTGTYEGSIDAQLYKTGQDINTRDSISVTGHFRVGTPAVVDPVTPGASTSLFGKSLKSIYVGDYTIKCPGETFTFSIAANGGSTLNGAPLVDSTHPGTIESENGPESNSINMLFNATSGDHNYVKLTFNKNGSFQPNSVHITSGSSSRTPLCYATADSVAPAATSGAVADLKNVAADQARSETLDCRGLTEADSVKTPTSFVISSDGSAQIAGLSYAAKTISEMKDAIVFADAAANASTKTASITYTVMENFQIIRNMAVSFGADMKTTGVIYATSDVNTPANIRICSPQ